jgi:ribosomal-protein-alanine N-acetyltransferase
MNGESLLRIYVVILAVDSSSDRMLLGLAEDGQVLAGYDGPAERSHSEKIIAQMDNLLKSADVTPDRISYLAAVTGPGSFTGLRVGIAVLIGLAKAWQKEMLGGSTHALYELYFRNRGIDAVTAIHCRAEQFYIFADGGGVEVMSVAEIVDRFRERVFGGPGAVRLQDLARRHDLGDLQLVNPQTYTGGELAQLFAANRDHFQQLDPTDLQINYVFKSQPEQLRELAQQQVTVDEMTVDDLDAIVRIEQESFTDAWQRESFEKDIQNRWVITIAAHRSKRCVGYANCLAVDDYGYLANIAVDKELRSQGVGRMLLDELCTRLRKQLKRRLLLDVRPSNQRAIMVYEKYGFAILTRRQNFYTNPPEDSYTMILELET